ncbi:aminotransferase class V-fold PLP-dependent enzyme [Nanohaloarchaea archaeon H01]|nr:aminotransferase class V-fold PLP-dependent enzyme [Nanohaloarchaea archaeon H01]
MNPNKIKEDFPIFTERPELSYLDSAATSQKPEKVINAVEEFYRKNNSNIGRGLYDLANDATQAYEGSREKVADFINAEKDEIVFVRNTTEGENLLASSLEFEGDIVLSEMAHHSEQLPWREKTEKNTEYLKTENGKISVKDAEKKINEDTGLVVISHISNVFGVENPVEEIIEIAHKNEALVVLDCAQSAPHMNLDVKDLDADFITFSGHKMLGPSGIGVLYGKKHLLEEMRPYQVGGGMVKSVEKDSVRYEDPPQKFEAGTPNISGAIGLKAAMEYLEEIGLEDIHEHDLRISEKIREGLEDIDSIKVLSPEDSILASFYSETVHSHDLAEVLNQKDVAVRAGNHCAQPQHQDLDLAGTVRASPYLYNTEEDVKKLLEAVREAQSIF